MRYLITVDHLPPIEAVSGYRKLPVVIEKILTRLNEKASSAKATPLPQTGYSRKRAYSTVAKKTSHSTQVAAAHAEAAGNDVGKCVVAIYPEFPSCHSYVYQS